MIYIISINQQALPHISLKYDHNKLSFITSVSIESYNNVLIVILIEYANEDAFNRRRLTVAESLARSISSIKGRTSPRNFQAFYEAKS